MRKSRHTCFQQWGVGKWGKGKVTPISAALCVQACVDCVDLRDYGEPYASKHEFPT